MLSLIIFLVQLPVGGGSCWLRQSSSLYSTDLWRRMQSVRLPERLVTIYRRSRGRAKPGLCRYGKGKSLLMRICDHPNILRLREAYTIDQDQWAKTTFLVIEPWAQACFQRFIMDLANSPDGRSSVCPWYSPQSLEHWPSIAKGCILGVKHLHENSIKHKDLKPSNILLLDESNSNFLQPKVRPIIADLGISKEYIAGAQTSFLGTY